MRKLSKAKSRMLSFILSLCMVMASIIIASSPVEVNAAKVYRFEDGPYYFIKNVRSGKYLTVQRNQFNVGQNIVQWSFTGENNQKFKLKYNDNKSCYQILSYYTTYAISITSKSDTVGLQAKLALSNSSDDKQLFWATNILDNGSYRFQTKASGCSRVLLVNGASVYKNASIVQGNQNTQWNDQWLVEIANYKRVEMSMDYANKNYNHRLTTYPNFDNYINPENKALESTNFASQCLAAGGFNYYKNGSESDWWYINKKEQSSQTQPYTSEGLSDNWDVKSKWYTPSEFRAYLINDLGKSYQLIDNARCFSNDSSYYYLLDNVECQKGDVIIIFNKANNKIVDIVISGENASGILVRSMDVYSHSPNSGYNYETLNQVVMNGTNYSCNNVKLEIYDMY